MDWITTVILAIVFIWIKSSSKEIKGKNKLLQKEKMTELDKLLYDPDEFFKKRQR